MHDDFGVRFFLVIFQLVILTKAFTCHLYTLAISGKDYHITVQHGQAIYDYHLCKKKWEQSTVLVSPLEKKLQDISWYSALHWTDKNSRRGTSFFSLCRFYAAISITISDDVNALVTFWYRLQETNDQVFKCITSTTKVWASFSVVELIEFTRSMSAQTSWFKKATHNQGLLGSV